ncbi:unnamed protein product [Rotaria sp. Silwood1]|nr:unnamed protein product [Rotaria sp. Silwood1]
MDISDTQGRIVAYLFSNEGSTTSSSGSGSDGENKQSKHLHHHQDDTILTSTTNSSFNIQQPGLQHMNRCYTSVNSADYRNYFAKQRAEIEATSFSSSDLEPTTFSNVTKDNRLVEIFLNIQ